MKYLLSLSLIVMYSLASFAQTELKFNTPFYEAVDEWVVFPGAEEEYMLGFVYIDEQAGFTFHFQGSVRYTGEHFEWIEKADQKSRTIRRLSQGTRPFYVLSEAEEVQLKIPETPDWLSIYKQNAHTDDYKIQVASLYNGVGASDLALPILKAVYQQEPNNSLLLFELCFAHNALKDYKNAIEVGKKAVEKFPKEELFYKELLYAYSHTSQLAKAEKLFRKYEKQSTSKKYRTEMAYNLTYSFFEKRDKVNFSEWEKVVLENTTQKSPFYQNVQLMEDRWE